jgi:hypothetical protein
MERALVRGAFTVVAHRNAGLALHLAGERHARARPHALGNDAAAEEVHALVVEVHVATATTREPGLPAEELGRHALEVHAASNGNVVRAVPGAHGVIRPQVRAQADGCGLLPERLVHLARKRAFAHIEHGLLALPVRLEHLLVELAARQHLFVHPDSLLRGGLHVQSLFNVRTGRADIERDASDRAARIRRRVRGIETRPPEVRTMRVEEKRRRRGNPPHAAGCL